MRVCVWGVWCIGQQLAWLRAKARRLEWHVEVDFAADVSMLWDHVAITTLREVIVGEISYACVQASPDPAHGARVHSIGRLEENRRNK